MESEMIKISTMFIERLNIMQIVKYFLIWPN